MQAADEPAVLFVRLEFAVGETLPVAPHFWDGEERGTFLVEDDGGDVVIEQNPFTVAIRPAGEEDLEGVVSAHPTPRPRPWPSRLLHFGCPLRVSCAAQAESVREKARPVFARAGIAALREPLAPQVLSTVLGMRIVRVPPQPGSESFLLVRRRNSAGDTAVLFRLSREQALGRWNRPARRIPRMIPSAPEDRRRQHELALRMLRGSRRR